MYLEMAVEEDKKMTEAWKADADGILIFTGLFSAAVATSISVSIQDVRPNSQDTATFYLANIYQVLADPNRSNFSLPSSPPLFSPPIYAVWVNTLWCLSLVISLTCALLATLLQQWARAYNTITQPRLSAHMRVRVHAFFSEGVEKFLLPWVVEALPALLHLSLYLFFACLVIFLWNVNLTMFRLVLSWVGICTVLYGCFTFMPVIYHNSPYHTPLSSLAWSAVASIPFVVLRAIRWLGRYLFSRAAYGRLRNLEKKYYKFLARGMQKTAEQTARNLSSEVDTRTFMRTFESLNDDDELERFFAGLPGFQYSRVVSNPMLSLTTVQKLRISEEMTEFMDRTFSSDLLPESVKNRRAIICAKAIDPAHFPGAFQWMFDKIFSEDQDGLLLTPEIGHIVKGWGNSGNRRTDLLVKAMVFGIIARAQRSNDRWFTLASNALGVRKYVLRGYAAQGDNLSLAILIHVIRHHLHLFRGQFWESKFWSILETASGFNVRDTSPKLQHEFCVLWNEVVRQAKENNSRSIPEYILRRIRGIYIALHENTDATPTGFSSLTSDEDSVLLKPSSYPVCNVPDHHPNLTTHVHEDIVHTTLTDFAPRTHPTSAGSSSSATTQVPSNARSMDVLLVDSNASALIIASSQPPHQIPDGGSPHSAAADAALGNGTDKTVAHSIIEMSTSTHLLPSTSPPGAVSHQFNADPRASSSGGPDTPSSFSIPVLDNAPVARPQFSSDPLSDYAPPGPESQAVIPAASPPPQSVSEPESSAAVEGESSMKTAIHNDKGASGSPLLPTPPEETEEPGYQPLHALHDKHNSKT